MKKQFATLLILVLALGLLPIQAYARDGSGSPLILKEGSDDSGNDSLNDLNQNKLKIEVDLKDTGSRVKIQNNGEFTSFVLDTTDKEEIISEIVSRTDLTEEQVRANIKYGSVPDLSNVQLRMKLQERVEAFKVRTEQLKQEREKWLQLYQQKKEQYKEFKDNWNTARDDWRGFKGKVEDFDNLSEEQQAQVIEKLKKFMTATIDRMESHTEILEKWISNVDLDESTVQDLQAEIDQIQIDLEDFKARVDEAETIDDLRTLAQEIKDYWQDNKHILKKTIAELSDLRMDNLVVRLETISANLQDRIDNLDSEGVDVTEMQSLLDSFNDNVASGKEQLNLAKEAYDNLDSSNQEEQFQLAKDYLKKANEYFREAYKNLKDLIKIYRNTDLGKNADLAELSVDPETI